MFDGVKINCSFLDFHQWETHPDLDFTLPVSAKTGEVLPESRRAKFKEMLFRITPSRKSPGLMWCYAEGSLHRFANGGADNSDQFTFDAFCATVQELARNFGIDPQRANLENLEFGLNIALPIPANDYLKTLICHGDRPFVEMSRDKKDLGKLVERQRYTFKLYDKGQQAETGDRNILRVEIKVSRMEFLKPYGITTLAHLTDPAKVAPLGNVLAQAFADVICYDGSIKESSQSEKERMMLKDFQNPKWWADLDKRRRYYYRQVYAEMMEKHGANNTQLSVVYEVQKQWAKLIQQAAESLDFLTGEKTAVHKENLDFLTVRMKGYKVQLDNNIIYKYKRVENENILPESPTQNTPELSVKTSAFCGCCGRDISRQRTGSRFCSVAHFGPGAKKCRNMATTRRRISTRQKEAATLDTLKGTPPGVVVSITVFTYDQAAAPRRVLRAAAYWSETESTGLPLQEAGRRAVRVVATTSNGQRHTLTWGRAKMFVASMVDKPPAPAAPPPPPVTSTPPQQIPTRLEWNNERTGPATLGNILNKILKHD